MVTRYNHESFDQWGITEEEIDYVTAQIGKGQSARSIEYSRNNRGNFVGLYVGLDQHLNLLEVGIEYMRKMKIVENPMGGYEEVEDADVEPDEWIYHAGPANKTNERKWAKKR